MGRRLVSAKYKIQKSSSKVGIIQIQNARDEKDLRGGSCGGERSFEVDHHKVVRHFVRPEKTVPTRPSHLSRTNHGILKMSKHGIFTRPVFVVATSSFDVISVALSFFVSFAGFSFSPT